jgi:hypothetical protein
MLKITGITSTGGALPYVSVLITTFNHQEYIGRCIDSILEQRCPFPIEILVLDDASSDNTQEIILSYAARFPEMIRPTFQPENLYLQHKKGLPILIENARGAYIAYCDGDDYWTDPEKLVKQVTFLEANPSFVLTFHNTINVDQSGLVITEPYAPNDGKYEFSMEELIVRPSNMLFLGTLLFRNLPIAFPPEYNLMPNGDNFIPMLLAAFGGAKYQPEIGPLAYRQHDAGAYSAKTNDERTRMHIQTYLQIASYYIRKNEPDIAQKIAAQHLIPRLSTYLMINFVP